LPNSTINSIVYCTINKAFKDTIVSNVITANDLKTKGISAINDATSNDDEAIITVRGKSKYIVVPIEHYNYLRECELEAALNESKENYKDGNYVKESVAKHLKRITGG